MWRCLSDSLVGRSHKQIGMLCQDACYISPLPTVRGEFALVIVCSDGAGSADLSHIGSRTACDTVARLVDKYLQSGGEVSDITHDLAKNWLAKVQHEIKQVAEAKSGLPQQFACTLLAGVLGDTCSAFFQLGDGAMVVGNKTNYDVVFWPQSGEYANTTFFVTDEKATEEMLFTKKGRVDEVAAFSDGLQMLALNYANKQAFAPFFVPIFRTLRESACEDELHVTFRQWLDSPQINERTDDDKSLAVAVRIDAEPPCAEPMP